MNNYFRVTGYSPKHDFSFIMDCYGMFEKLWQFSALLVEKELDIIEVGNAEKFIDITTNKIEKDAEHIALRASMQGKPKNIIQEYNGKKYNAIKVADKIYIPDMNKSI